MYLLSLRQDRSQGDIFDNFPVVDVNYIPAKSDPDVTIRRSRIILSSYDCDYDNNRNVTLAEVKPLTGINNPKHWASVRNYDSRKTFYLPAHENAFEESYADFRHINRVQKELIAQRLEDHPRLLSLSDDGRLALQRGISLFFSG